jgi:hypothetical protein
MKRKMEHPSLLPEIQERRRAFFTAPRDGATAELASLGFRRSGDGADGTGAALGS